MGDQLERLDALIDEFRDAIGGRQDFRNGASLGEIVRLNERIVAARSELRSYLSEDTRILNWIFDNGPYPDFYLGDDPRGAIRTAMKENPDV